MLDDEVDTVDVAAGANHAALGEAEREIDQVTVAADDAIGLAVAQVDRRARMPDLAERAVGVVLEGSEKEQVRGAGRGGTRGQQGGIEIGLQETRIALRVRGDDVLGGEQPQRAGTLREHHGEPFRADRSARRGEANVAREHVPGQLGGDVGEPVRLVRDGRLRYRRRQVAQRKRTGGR